VRLLVVEDEHRLADRLARGLREEGFAVDTAATSSVARDLASGTDYDLVLLDLKLPDGSGAELIETWRREGLTTPILVLTARDLLVDKISGLKAGADDYVTKPFAFGEVLARIHALLRRRGAAPRDLLRIGDLHVDRTSRHVERAGHAIALTAKEYALLEYLALHAGHVLSRSTLAEHVWDSAYEAQSNVIDVIVSRVRRKVDVPGAERLIHTVGGVGYVLRRG
jgi:DNA-binding response OmpR family regulator